MWLFFNFAAKLLLQKDTTRPKQQKNAKKDEPKPV